MFDPTYKKTTAVNRCFLWDLYCSLLLGLLGCTDIHHNEQYENREENKREERSQLGREASFSGICIDEGGERLKTATTFGEERYSEIINRQRERQDETRHHTRAQLRQ